MEGFTCVLREEPSMDDGVFARRASVLYVRLSVLFFCDKC